MNRATNRDTLRQVITIIATIVTLIFNIFSNRITGRTVGEIAHNNPAIISPADYAFAIWAVIYLGLIAFTIYQALPAQKSNPRLQRIGYWYVLSCTGNIAWEFIWLNQHIILSVVPMLMLLIANLAIYIRADINRTKISRIERWCVNMPFSIYLGWITVASIVNITVAFEALHWNGLGISPTVWTMILLVTGTAIAIFIGVTRIDIAYLATTTWAYIAIIVKNVTLPPIVIVTSLLVVLALATIVLVALRHPSDRMQTPSPVGIK